MTSESNVKKELVEHPAHYNNHPSGVECIEIIQHYQFNIGNAIKYLWRAGLKPNEPMLQDLMKAKVYVEFEIEKQKRALAKKQEKLDVSGKKIASIRRMDDVLSSSKVEARPDGQKISDVANAVFGEQLLAFAKEGEIAKAEQEILNISEERDFSAWPFLFELAAVRELLRLIVVNMPEVAKRLAMLPRDKVEKIESAKQEFILHSRKMSTTDEVLEHLLPSYGVPASYVQHLKEIFSDPIE